MSDGKFTARPCPKCGGDDVWYKRIEVAVLPAFDVRCPATGLPAEPTLRTHQDGSECAHCGEQWSTAAECAAADERLIAQGWKPQVYKARRFR